VIAIPPLFRHALSFFFLPPSLSSAGPFQSFGARKADPVVKFRRTSPPPSQVWNDIPPFFLFLRVFFFCLFPLSPCPNLHSDRNVPFPPPVWRRPPNLKGSVNIFFVDFLEEWSNSSRPFSALRCHSMLAILLRFLATSATGPLRERRTLD